jgi:hypothetical protein
MGEVAQTQQVTMFRKYDHVERLGHEEVEGLTVGEVYVFPKLDGTNSSAWFVLDNDKRSVCCGSRTRTLAEDADNAGFWRWAHERETEEKFIEIMRCHPGWTIYGEWLVPHTLKTYREDAWRRFWVFDVFGNAEDKYLHYREYEFVLRSVGLDVIEPLCIYTNPSDEQLRGEADRNTYLILDGGGAGEGVVMKNYAWENRFGRQPWAKLVRNEFKEENKRAFGTAEKGGESQVEAAIAEEFVTQTLVEKARAKIVTELSNADLDAKRDNIEPPNVDPSFARLYKRVEERNRAQLIPRLLGAVFYELINEEIWAALKKHKFPVVDFKRLRAHSILRTKLFAADLF